jgi:hypothetical protein
LIFASSTLTPRISFLTYATLPEEQRFRISLKISDQISSQILPILPVNVSEFLFTSQRGTFFVHLGDLPRSRLRYIAMPRRGIELGFTNFFSVLTDFGNQDLDLINEQRAMGLNFCGSWIGQEPSLVCMSLERAPLRSRLRVFIVPQ